MKGELPPTKDLGARHARGDVLVFLDGHCKPESGAIERLVADVEQLAGQAIVIPSIPVAAGRAISGLRQALAQIPKTEPVGRQTM